MKKIILLIIILTPFSNFNYASFPVSEQTHQLSLQSTELSSISDDDVKLFLGFIVGVFSVFLLPLLFLFSPNKAFKKGMYIGLLTLLLLIVVLFVSGNAGIVAL